MEVQELCALAFQTAMWQEAKFRCYELKTICRQVDEEFVRALMDVREGIVTVAVERLVSDCQPLKVDDGLMDFGSSQRCYTARTETSIKKTLISSTNFQQSCKNTVLRTQYTEHGGAPVQAHEEAPPRRGQVLLK